MEELDRLLRAHRPADPVEGRFLARMRSLLREPGDPFARTRFDPGHFTASAFVLAPCRSRLLLVHHEKLDRWLQPGGHLEEGDADAESAARREVAEETGLAGLLPLDGREGVFDLDIHEIPARGREPAHLHFDLRFLLLSPGWELSRGEGVREARWLEFAAAARANREPAMARVLGKLDCNSTIPGS